MQGEKGKCREKKQISHYGDGRRVARREAVVAAPGEFQGARLGGDGAEADERVGRHRRVQVGAEHFDAVVAAGEAGQDVARHQLAQLRAAEAGLHAVAGKRADLDHLAALRGGRNVDDQARHAQIRPSSRQADSVTTTSTWSDQNEPSLICASAITVPVSAMRARVAIAARPARGPSQALITFGCGFFSVKTWIARTWSPAVIGLSTVTAIGTELPLSISGGTSSLTRPRRGSAPPVTLRTAASSAALRSAAMLGGNCACAPVARAPQARIRNWRRVFFISACSGRQRYPRFVRP